MLTKTTKSMRLQTYMNMHNFHITCIKSTRPNKTQIDHMWTNARTQQCHVGTTQAYWTNHNPNYFTFRLLNCIPQFIIPTINEQMLKRKQIPKKISSIKPSHIHILFAYSNIDPPIKLKSKDNLNPQQ